jgi:hypothetical protein
MAIADVKASGSTLEVRKMQAAFGGKTILDLADRDSQLVTALNSDVTKDGKRILLAIPVDSGAPDTVDLVTNWRTLLGK